MEEHSPSWSGFQPKISLSYFYGVRWALSFILFFYVFGSDEQPPPQEAGGDISDPDHLAYEASESSD